MTFREFVEDKDQLNTVKTAIMNFLGASNDALDDPLVNFRNYRKLLDNQRNPQFARLIGDADNKSAIVKAIENASVTKISIADLIALFRAGMSGNLPGGRKAPTEPQQDQGNMKQPQQNQQSQQKPANPPPPKAGQGSIPGIG